MANGALSVDTEHLFPIIKKWLYSEKDIYLREVLSNSCDAVTKHKRLASLGETAESETPYRIDVRMDADARIHSKQSSSASGKLTYSALPV